MTLNKFLRHSFLAAAAVATLAPIASAATGADRSERAERRFETRFLTTLIDDHALTLQLAELAQSRATHEELQQFGVQTETASAAELAQLQTWLQTWHDESHDGELSRRAERLVQQLSQLSGEEFEIELIEALIEHHLDALHATLQALRSAQRPELINLAALSVAARADEVAQLRLWLEQWYGDGAEEAGEARGDSTSTSNTEAAGADLNLGATVNASVAPAAGNLIGNGSGELNRARPLPGKFNN